VTPDASVRFAALMAGTAVQGIETLCERLRVPNPYRELALLCARLQDRIEEALSLDASGLLDLLEGADAFRRPERFGRLMLSSAARSGAPEAQALLKNAAAAAAQVALDTARMRELKGPAIAAALRAARIERLQRFQSERRRS
jgi:tRNA nucleotidyltransferase (CCA-adding enzyme)